MSEEPSSRRAVGGDLIIPALAGVFTLYYFWSIKDSPWTAKVNAYFVGSILLVLVTAFLARAAGALLAGRATFELRSLLEPLALLPVRLGLLALTLGYVVLVRYGGFTITTCVFLFAAILLLNRGERAGLIAALAGALALGGYLLFILAFETRFPRGPFERVARDLLGG